MRQTAVAMTATAVALAAAMASSSVTAAATPAGRASTAAPATPDHSNPGHSKPDYSYIPDFTYTVKRGDTLFVLTRDYLAGNPALVAVRRLNHIRAPRLLPIGKVLRIPRALLRDEATGAIVASFAGPVTLREGAQTTTAHAGAKLAEGAEIETGRNAFVTLRLSDGTTVSLPSQSHVRLARLRRVLLTGSIERTIDLEAGRVESGVTPMRDPNSNFRVTTPITVSAVRGTEFRVAYDDAGGTAGTSVVEGRVTVGRGDSAAGVLAPAGFGVASTATSDSGAVPLLPAPELVDPGKVQTEETLHFTLRPLGSAAAYRVQVARDAGALDLIAEATAASPDFTLPAIAAGSYFLRVSALDSRGLEGLPDTFAFERRRNSITGAASQSGSGHDRRFEFQWQSVADGSPHFHFRMVRKSPDPATPNATTIVDEAGLTGASLALTNLPPGEYEWQVSSILFTGGRAIETWTSPQRLHIFAEH